MPYTFDPLDSDILSIDDVNAALLIDTATDYILNDIDIAPSGMRTVESTEITYIDDSRLSEALRLEIHAKRDTKTNKVTVSYRIATGDYLKLSRAKPGTIGKLYTTPQAAVAGIESWLRRQRQKVGSSPAQRAMKQGEIDGFAQGAKIAAHIKAKRDPRSLIRKLQSAARVLRPTQTDYDDSFANGVFTFSVYLPINVMPDKGKIEGMIANMQKLAQAEGYDIRESGYLKTKDQVVRAIEQARRNFNYEKTGYLAVHLRIYPVEHEGLADFNVYGYQVITKPRSQWTPEEKAAAAAAARDGYPGHFRVVIGRRG